MTVSGSTFEGSSAQIGSDGSYVSDPSDLGGGAIGIGSGSHVSISDSTVTQNISGKNRGAIAPRKFYGAYDTDFSDVKLPITKSTFSGNATGKIISENPHDYNSVTGLYDSGNGSALFNTFNDTVVDLSTFTENSAINGEAITNFYDKGKTQHFGSITITNSEFSNNKAIVDINVDKTFDNGAVYAYIGTLAQDTDSKVVIGNSTFTGNNAVNDGAIANRVQLEVSDSTFMGNTANGWGGAIDSDATSKGISVASSVFKNNHSVYNGGALGSYRGLTITDFTFKGNMDQLGQSDFREWNKPVEGPTAIGGGAIFLGASLRPALPPSKKRSSRATFLATMVGQLLRVWGKTSITARRR